MRVRAPPLSSTEFPEIFEKNLAGSFKNALSFTEFRVSTTYFYSMFYRCCKDGAGGSRFFLADISSDLHKSEIIYKMLLKLIFVLTFLIFITIYMNLH